MKLSTRSRYGTRMMLDLAEHYNEGPIQIGDIAKRQGISVKYLEQLIIPLKKADFISSVRGPKGGHMLATHPKEITIGQIVHVLEGGIELSICIGDAKLCGRSKECLIRDTWREATKAMHDKLNATSLAKVIRVQRRC
jgi:Rrf2 family transcriptional regulator, iron-sulfur cluster assembly transcription factor